jgi:hypothetical protein
VRSEIVFEDDEIVDALAAAVRKRGGPVPSELLQELAPGKPTAWERSIVSQQLVRLARNGSGLAWRTTEAPQR